MRTQRKKRYRLDDCSAKNKMGIKFIPFSPSVVRSYTVEITFPPRPCCVFNKRQSVKSLARVKERKIFVAGGCAQRERKLVLLAYDSGGKMVFVGFHFWIDINSLIFNFSKKIDKIWILYEFIKEFKTHKKLQKSSQKNQFECMCVTFYVFITWHTCVLPYTKEDLSHIHWRQNSRFQRHLSIGATQGVQSRGGLRVDGTEKIITRTPNLLDSVKKCFPQNCTLQEHRRSVRPLGTVYRLSSWSLIHLT